MHPLRATGRTSVEPQRDGHRRRPPEECRIPRSSQPYGQATVPRDGYRDRAWHPAASSLARVVDLLTARAAGGFRA